MAIAIQHLGGYGAARHMDNRMDESRTNAGSNCWRDYRDHVDLSVDSQVNIPASVDGTLIQLLPDGLATSSVIGVVEAFLPLPQLRPEPSVASLHSLLSRQTVAIWRSCSRAVEGTRLSSLQMGQISRGEYRADARS